MNINQQIQKKKTEGMAALSNRVNHAAPESLSPATQEFGPGVGYDGHRATIGKQQSFLQKSRSEAGLKG